MVLLALSIILPMAALEVRALPTGYDLKWEETEGAVWYDIYIDDVFRARLEAGTTETSIGGLTSNTEHKISFAVRDAENHDLKVEFAHVPTTNWDGLYRWVAPEGHDTNKGKLKEINYEVITKVHPKYGQYYEVWAHVPEGRMRLYPIMEFDNLMPGWTGFLDDSEHARTYKITSEKYNKSKVLPKRWRINTFGIDWNQEWMEVETIATLGIRVKTTQYFIWDIDEDGNKTMTFVVDAPAFIKAFLTLCEEPGRDKGEFVLTRVE